MTAPNTMQRDAMLRQTPGGILLPLPSPLLAALPAELQGLPMQWFIEPLTMLAVAPGASATNTFQTDRTHAFAAWYGALKVRSADDQTDRDADPAAFQMTDTNNLVYQPPQAPIDVALAWGNAKQPAVWPSPLVVGPNSGVTLTVTNQHAANTNNYRFAFMGVLIKLSAN
jgi:hypothetical protein